MFENITVDVLRERIPALTAGEVDSLLSVFRLGGAMVDGARRLGPEAIMKIIDVLPVAFPVSRGQLFELFAEFCESGDAGTLVSLMMGSIAAQSVGVPTIKPDTVN